MTAFAAKINRTQPLTPSDRKVLISAALELDATAQCIHDSDTLDGEWGPDERQAKREHDKLRRLAAKLRRIAGQKASKS